MNEGPGTYFVVAGPNGAGKSTLTANGAFAAPVIDPDAIARRLNPEEPAAAALSAGKAAAKEIATHLEARTSFVQETTLSGASTLKTMADARMVGMRVELHYVGTDSKALTIGRVADRVTMGGHDIPLQDQIRRFGRSLANLPEAIKRADRSVLYDNSGSGHRRVGIIEGSQVTLAPDAPKWAAQAASDAGMGRQALEGANADSLGAYATLLKSLPHQKLVEERERVVAERNSVGREVARHDQDRTLAAAGASDQLLERYQSLIDKERIIAMETGTRLSDYTAIAGTPIAEQKLVPGEQWLGARFDAMQKDQFVMNAKADMMRDLARVFTDPSKAADTIDREMERRFGDEREGAKTSVITSLMNNETLRGSTGLFDFAGRRERAEAESQLPVAKMSITSYGVALEAAGQRFEQQERALSVARAVTIPQVSPELSAVLQHLSSGDRPAEAFVGVNKDVVLQDAGRVLDAIERRIEPVGPGALNNPEKAKQVGLEPSQVDLVRDLRQALTQVQRVGVAQDQVETLREGKGLAQ